jgi:hypothetical protein
MQCYSSILQGYRTIIKKRSSYVNLCSSMHMHYRQSEEFLFLTHILVGHLSFGNPIPHFFQILSRCAVNIRGSRLRFIFSFFCFHSFQVLRQSVARTYPADNMNWTRFDSHHPNTSYRISRTFLSTAGALRPCSVAP